MIQPVHEIGAGPYLHDALGSTRALVARAPGGGPWEISDSWSFDAYGRVLEQYSDPSAGAPGNRWLFADEERTVEIGLDYLRARWMTSNTGTFVTRDRWPGTCASPQTINAYSYVVGDPVHQVDPSGYSGEMVAVASDISAGVTGISTASTDFIVGKHATAEQAITLVAVRAKSIEVTAKGLAVLDEVVQSSFTSPNAALVRKWFGEDVEAALALVQDNMADYARDAPEMRVKVLPENHAKYIAYSAFGTMRLTPAFFDESYPFIHKVRDSQVGTYIHETGHWHAKVRGLRAEFYGYKDSLELVNVDSERARHNNDNYVLFALEAYLP
jgi:RHS repeat-associated protein